MNDKNIDIEKLESKYNKLASLGKTPIYIAINNTLSGIIAVSDKVKQNSKKAIETLHEMGIKVAMVTGDNKKTAHTIAKEVGIDIVVSEVLPKDKADEVKKLEAELAVIAEEVEAEEASTEELDDEVYEVVRKLITDK